MLNSDKPKLDSELDHVENVLADLTPDPRHFAGSNYSSDDVDKDLKQLEDFKCTSDYKKIEERSEAKLLEKTFADMVERGDWFGEYELYGDDPDFLAIVTFPTSEVDDAFNHIDLISTINNEITGHKTLPFAIDLTYNADDKKMKDKFKWRHVYGKSKKAPEEVSEFGKKDIGKDHFGKDVIETKKLPLKFRYGLKIPGFASAKYFEDKNDPWNARYPKGRIDIMPRFIVGYSTAITDVLASGMPTKEYKEQYGEAAYQKKRIEYKNAERCAKWCTLLECSEQASDIRYMLEKMGPEETKWMRPEELEKAKKQIIAMDTYFNKAVQIATEQAQTDPDEMAAMKYADRDIVRQAIMEHSDDTYIKKSWK